MKTHAAATRLLQHRREGLNPQICDVILIAQHGVKAANNVVGRDRLAVGIDLPRREVQGAGIHARVTGSAEHLVA